jgi:GntR family transcriptional regulator, transcriptional repressor for pyruvate dehydrogenase complex
VSAQVRQRLTDAIAAGDLAPGTPLPAERTLCQEFGVARTSVREAIQGLVIAGFVERRGNRSVVAERLPDLDFGRSADEPAEAARHLLELRLAIEPSLAGLAAERATAEQRRRIQALGQATLNGVDELREVDAELSRSLGQAAANPLLCEVLAKATSFGASTGALASMWTGCADLAGARDALRRVVDTVVDARPAAASAAMVALLAHAVGAPAG